MAEDVEMEGGCDGGLGEEAAGLRTKRGNFVGVATPAYGPTAHPGSALSEGAGQPVTQSDVRL